MKRAFTLIELLVVIAIIAILAAILFPVFAQAKVAAKKSVTISNNKQWGTAMVMYMTDYDDSMPFSFGVRPVSAGGTWFVNGLHPYPKNANSAAPWNDPERRELQAGLHWANSCQPYVKNLQLVEVPVANARATAGDVLEAGVTRNEPALAMNGFMHTLNGSEINAPSSAIMLWTGRGNTAGVNRSLQTPSLACTAAPVAGVLANCRFNASGLPQVGATTGWNWTGDFSGGGSVWTFERQCVFTRTDSSAKVRPCGRDAVAGVPAPPGATLEQALNDPYLRVDINGTVPLGAWIVNCTSAGSTVAYWCYFRPDRD